jgi:MFS family permease
MAKPADSAVPADSPGIPGRWLVLALVALDYFLLYSQRNLLGFLEKPLVAGLELTSKEFGWLQPAFNLPYAAAQLGVGFLADRYPRRKVLMGSLLLSVASLALMGMAVGFWDLFAWRVFMGLAQAASVPAIASAMADTYSSRTRSTAISIYLVFTYLGQIPNNTFSGAIADIPIWSVPFTGGTITGWRMALLLAGGLGLFGVFLLWGFFREPPRTEQAPSHDLRSVSLRSSLSTVLRVPTFWGIMAAYALYVWPFGAILHWVAGHLVNQFGISQARANFEFTFWLNVGLVVGLLAAGRLGDYMAERRMDGRVRVQLAGLVLCIPALVFLGLGNNLLLLSLPILAYGIGSGLYQSQLWTSTFEVINPAYRATAIGMLNVSAGITGLWVNPTIGLYKDAYGSVGVPVAALSLFVTASLGLLIFSSLVLLPRDYRGPLRQVPVSAEK